MQDIELVKAYHVMFRTGGHTPKEIIHLLILSIQMVQVSLATIAGFLSLGSTSCSSHVTWNLKLLSD
jgi:hypothetical protein